MTSRERAERWCQQEGIGRPDGPIRRAAVEDLTAEFDAVRAEARREALEEAEKACDPEGEWDCGYEEPAHWCQERIRALKEKAM
jgi:hypothetical protein